MSEKLSLWLRIFFVLLSLACFAGSTYAQDPIKIGVVTALSAPGGVETGKALLAGAEIAAEMIKAMVAFSAVRLNWL